jgi:hypothetical protein
LPIIASVGLFVTVFVVYLLILAIIFSVGLFIAAFVVFLDLDTCSSIFFITDRCVGSFNVDNEHGQSRSAAATRVAIG